MPIAKGEDDGDDPIEIDANPVITGTVESDVTSDISFSRFEVASGESDVVTDGIVKEDVVVWDEMTTA